MRLSSFIAVVVGALGWAILGLLTVAPNPTIAGFLGLAVVAICVIALYRATTIGFFAPVAVTFWSFVLVWVGFAALLQIRDNQLPWADAPLNQYFVTAQTILLAAVIAFWAGYSRPATPAPRSVAPQFEVTVARAALTTACTVALAAFSLSMTGGLAVRFTTRDDLRNALEQAGLIGGKDLALLGLLNTLPAAASLISLVLCLFCIRNKSYRSAASRSILLAATASAATLNLIYNNPLSASRFATFSVLLACTFALIRFDSQRRRSLFSTAMVVGLAVIYPLANLFRNEESRSNLRLGADAYYTFDFDGFQQTVNAVYYTDAHGYTWGHHLFSATFFWVPRSLWKGKAIAAGNVVAAARGYEFHNLSLPFWAEVFMEFSLLGVVILFFFYGRLARRFDTAMSTQVTGLAALLTVLFAACQIGLLRGPLGAQIPFVGAALVVVLASMMPRWRTARSQP